MDLASKVAQAPPPVLSCGASPSHCPRLLPHHEQLSPPWIHPPNPTLQHPASLLTRKHTNLAGAFTAVACTMHVALTPPCPSRSSCCAPLWSPGPLKVPLCPCWYPHCEWPCPPQVWELLLPTSLSGVLALSCFYSPFLFPFPTTSYLVVWGSLPYTLGVGVLEILHQCPTGALRELLLCIPDVPARRHKLYIPDLHQLASTPHKMSFLKMLLLLLWPWPTCT